MAILSKRMNIRVGPIETYSHLPDVPQGASEAPEAHVELLFRVDLGSGASW